MIGGMVSFGFFKRGVCFGFEKNSGFESRDEIYLFFFVVVNSSELDMLVFLSF